MTGIGDLHPAFILVVGAALLPVVPAPARSVLALASQLAGLAALAGLGSGARIVAPFAGFELVLLQVDPLSHLFGFIFLLIGTIAAVYAWHLRDAGQQSAALLYGAGALGVTFAGDLLTLLIF